MQSIQNKYICSIQKIQLQIIYLYELLLLYLSIHGFHIAGVERPRDSAGVQSFYFQRSASLLLWKYTLHEQCETESEGLPQPNLAPLIPQGATLSNAICTTALQQL